MLKTIPIPRLSFFVCTAFLDLRTVQQAIIASKQKHLINNGCSWCLQHDKYSLNKIFQSSPFLCGRKKAKAGLQVSLATVHHPTEQGGAA